VKLGQPDRQVVALQGDGGFMFAQAESLWTMARYEILRQIRRRLWCQR
jgi:thiamine pyrophosphate-dependent acetolactate synthase large subunit-like protein